MNKEKISSQEIIDLVALKASVSKRAAEEFLKVMISSIEDALLAGDSVKIKGFGTFKLQWNEPRKSVNVQTGQEIILDGYYKVAFAPETSLKTLVNEPFAHLEAVELDDENNFILPEKEEEPPLDPLRIFTEQAGEIRDLLSEIQALSTTSESVEEIEMPVDVESEVIEDISEPAQQNLLTDLPEEVPVLENVPEIVIEESLKDTEVVEEIVSDFVPEAVVEPEPVSEIELKPERPVIQEEVPIIVEIAPAVEDEEIVVENIPVSTPEVVVESDKLESTPFLVNAKPTRKSKRWLLIPLVLLVLASFVGLYFYYPQVNTFGNKVISKSRKEIAYLKGVTIPDMYSSVAKWFSPKPKAAAPIVQTVVVSKDSDNVEDVDSVGDVPEVDAVAGVKAKVKVQASVDTLQQMFDHPRVYEEYIASEQIKPGSRLTIMSLRYYGSKDFWVYIYEANKERIQNPDKIEMGTLIRIPKLDPRLIDASNPRCLKKAHELHDEYVKKK